LNQQKNLSDKAQDLTLEKKAKQNFYNKSKFDFKTLLDDSNNIASNLRNYINNYSHSVRDILSYFNFEDEIEKLDNADLLYMVVKNFSEIDYLQTVITHRLKRWLDGCEQSQRLPLSNFFS